MPTFIYSKEKFLEFIKEQVEDDKIIVFTNELEGNISISKRSGLKISHKYAHDAFKDEGIGHIAFGKSIALNMIIADKSRLSERSEKALVESTLVTP